MKLEGEERSTYSSDSGLAWVESSCKSSSISTFIGLSVWTSAEDQFPILLAGRDHDQTRTAPDENGFIPDNGPAFPLFPKVFIQFLIRTLLAHDHTGPTVPCQILHAALNHLVRMSITPTDTRPYPNTTPKSQ